MRLPRLPGGWPALGLLFGTPVLGAVLYQCIQVSAKSGWPRSGAANVCGPRSPAPETPARIPAEALATAQPDPSARYWRFSAGLGPG